MKTNWLANIEKGKIVITTDNDEFFSLFLSSLEQTDNFINKLIDLRNQLTNEDNQAELRKISDERKRTN